MHHVTQEGGGYAYKTSMTRFFDGHILIESHPRFFSQPSAQRSCVYDQQKASQYSKSIKRSINQQVRLVYLNTRPGDILAHCGQSPQILLKNFHEREYQTFFKSLYKQCMGFPGEQTLTKPHGN